jgi:N-formylglutamate deformylase
METVLKRSSRTAWPVLISTPHSSAHVPHWIEVRMRESGEPEADLRRRLLDGSDPYTDQIFHVPEAACVLNAVASRFVIDLNRDPDEEGDNGAIKLTGFDRKPFYPSAYVLTVEERKRRARLYHEPYHRELAKAIADPNILFFIDGHSMDPIGPSIGPDEGKPRPAICIANVGDAEGNQMNGTHTSCPPALARRIRQHAEKAFAEVLSEAGMAKDIQLNQPFRGGYIARRYSDPSTPPVGDGRDQAWKPGIMIEFNRALYMDMATLLPLPGRIDKLRAGIRALTEAIVDEL